MSTITVRNRKYYYYYMCACVHVLDVCVYMCVFVRDPHIVQDVRLT